MTASLSSKTSAKALQKRVRELEIALECALRCPGPARLKTLCASCRDNSAKLLGKSVEPNT